MKYQILNTGSQFSKWNLIGNPYTANVDFEAFYNLNKTQLNTGAFQAIYGYNDTTNKWTIWNQLTIDDITIREVFVPGQGFFVPSKPDNGLITFLPSMRRTGISDDFILNRPTETVNIASTQLKMTTDSQEFSTAIYLVEGQTTGLDVGYDAAVFNETTEGIFTHLVDDNEGLEMAIQTLPFINIDSVIVPLGVKANQGVEFSIGIDTNNSTLPNGIDLYLVDTQTNIWTLLNTSEYTLTPNENITGVGRFSIHFQPQNLSIKNEDFSTLRIYNVNKTLHIDGVFSSKTDIEVYDLLGRQSVTKQLKTNIAQQSISLNNLANGIYLVKIKNDEKYKIQKILLK